MDNLLSYLRLQAELEEAKEEARIQAQEEIVARIQEAKVIIIIEELWTSGKSMGLVTVHFFFFFLSRRLPSKKWRSRSKSTRRRCQIYMKPWWVMIVLVEACSFKAVNAIQLSEVTWDCVLHHTLWLVLKTSRNLLTNRMKN